MDVFKRFNGRLLVADETEVQRSMTAPDCVEISKDRKAGADAVALLAKGIDA